VALISYVFAFPNVIKALAMFFDILCDLQSENLTPNISLASLKVLALTNHAIFELVPLLIYFQKTIEICYSHASALCD
jgi:hypothetical protein